MTMRYAQLVARRLANDRRRRARTTSSPLTRIKDNEGLKEECAIFGVIGPTGSASTVALGLHALQHRGQVAAGIASFDEEKFFAERHPGLVSESFAKPEVMQRLPGRAAIGHTRYPTQGADSLRNIQPLYADLSIGGAAIAHNGNLTNARRLRRELESDGHIFQTTTDTELFLHLAARAEGDSFHGRLIAALRQVEGAYAVVALTRDALIGARDPIGIRPLVLGSLKGVPVLASETCALDAIGATFERDIEPGEMVVCTPEGVESVRFAPKPAKPRLCIFELIYFARPDSVFDGRSVYQARKALGRELAIEAPCADADLVSAVPDSGVPAAVGYAQTTELPYELGIVRSHYVGRTFIKPQQAAREESVSLKHSPNRSVLEGKSVLLVDDSVVRGTTSRKIVSAVRAAGARQVHLRVACPPIEYPCYYGIDTPTREELLAVNRSVDELRELIGADSLAFLSLDGVYRALGREKRDAAAPDFTDHVFTGEYPTDLTDLTEAREAKEKAKQLSLLVDPPPRSSG